MKEVFPQRNLYVAYWCGIEMDVVNNSLVKKRNGLKWTHWFIASSPSKSMAWETYKAIHPDRKVPVEHTMVLEYIKCLGPCGFHIQGKQYGSSHVTGEKVSDGDDDDSSEDSIFE